jgi:hypothetical protein
VAVTEIAQSMFWDEVRVIRNNKRLMIDISVVVVREKTGLKFSKKWAI